MSTVHTRAVAVLGWVLSIASLAVFPRPAAASDVSIAAGPGWATIGEACPRGWAHGALTLGSLPTQTDVKTVWDDGSIRFAIVTASVPAAATYILTAASPLRGSFTPVNPAASVQFTLGGDVYLATLPMTPSSDSWLAGPLVQEHRYVVAPVRPDGTTLAFVNVIFDVRTYCDGQTRLDVTVENVTDATGATLVSYSVDIIVDGQTLYHHNTMTQYYLTRWRQVFDLGLLVESPVTLDMEPLYGAHAVPRFLPTVADPSYAVDGPTFDIMQRGGLAYDDMGSPGGRPDIAPYPDWVAEYLVHENPATRTYMMRTADLSGSQPIHIRQASGTLVSIDQQPQFWLDARGQTPYTPESDRPKGVLSSLGPLGPDCAHEPSLAYVPYLLTGDRYYADEMAFWANYGLLATHPVYNRAGSQGILASSQVRAFAWTLRELTDAAAYLPDADPMKSSFVAKLANNLAWADDYVAGTASNADWSHPVNADLGTSFEQTSGLPSLYGSLIILQWQQNFLAWSLTHAHDQGFSGGLVLRDRIVSFANTKLNSPDLPPALGTQFFDIVGTYPTSGDHTAWTYFTTMGQVDAADAGPLGDHTDPVVYADDARLSIMAAITLGLPGAQGAYAYLMNLLAPHHIQDGFEIDSESTVVLSGGTGSSSGSSTGTTSGGTTVGGAPVSSAGSGTSSCGLGGGMAVVMLSMILVGRARHRRSGIPPGGLDSARVLS